MTGYEKSQDSADEDEGGQHEDAESVVSDIGVSGSINALSLSLLSSITKMSCNLMILLPNAVALGQ